MKRLLAALSLAILALAAAAQQKPAAVDDSPRRRKEKARRGCLRAFEGRETGDRGPPPGTVSYLWTAAASKSVPGPWQTEQDSAAPLAIERLAPVKPPFSRMCDLAAPLSWQLMQAAVNGETTESSLLAVFSAVLASAGVAVPAAIAEA